MLNDLGTGTHLNADHPLGSFSDPANTGKFRVPFLCLSGIVPRLPAACDVGRSTDLGLVPNTDDWVSTQMRLLRTSDIAARGVRSRMTQQELRVQVVGDNIVVTLPGYSYAVTYYKPKGSSGCS